jgi:phosphoribosylanthranilate isomerase
MRLKICGLNNHENISKIVSLSPDYIGFIFYQKSKRYISSWILCDLLPKIPRTIKKVGVFVNEDVKVVETLFNIYKLDFVQLHGNESPEYCAELSLMKIPIIKAFSIDEFFDFRRLDVYTHFCSHFLFDTKGKLHGGNGTKFNWDLINKYEYKTPFFLSGGIELDDVDAINQLSFKQLHAIDINSKFETEPGVKEISRIKEFKKRLNHKYELQYEH